MAAPPRVHVIGPVFFDVIFSGLGRAPSGGTEVRAAGLGSAPGGAANVAVALARLGVQVTLSAAFADDLYGRWLVATLEDEGIDLSWSTRDPSWTTPVTASLAYGGERSMVTHETPCPSPPPTVVPVDADAVFALLDPLEPLQPSDLRRPGRLVCTDIGWDPDEAWPGSLLDRLAGVDVFLPNATEAMALTGAPEPVAAARLLGERVGTAVVTRGDAGAVAVEGHELVEAPHLPVDALDPTGAGDVFDAGFLYGTIAGWPLHQRLLFANLCAGQSVRWSGGSLSAPCWLDLAAWWHAVDAEPGSLLARRYAFLPDLIAAAPASRPCRRPTATIASDPTAPPDRTTGDGLPTDGERHADSRRAGG